MAKSKPQQAAATEPDNTDSKQQPTTDGSQIKMSRFLRELEGTQHLFDSDVAYFIVSASAITPEARL